MKKANSIRYPSICGSFVRTIVLALFLGLAFSKPAAKAGILAYWPFDGNATDSSGNGFHGTLSGYYQWVSDRFGAPGHAVLFGGNTGWMDVDDEIKGASLSFAAWIKMDSLPDISVIISREDGSGTAAGFSYRFGLNYDMLRLEIYRPDTSPGSVTVKSAPGSITTGTWYHVAGVFDTSQVSVYINGNLTASASHSQPINTNSGLPTAVGTLQGWNVQWFSGVMDDLMVFDHALSASEVWAIYSVPEPSSAALLLLGVTAACSARRVLRLRTPGLSKNTTPAFAAMNGKTKRGLLTAAALLLLAAARPAHAYLIHEDFEDGTLPSTLELAGDGVTFTEGGALFGLPGRSYLRTKDSGFHETSFIAEVTVSTGGNIVFFGIGEGAPSGFYSEPALPSLNLRLHPDTLVDGRLDAADNFEGGEVLSFGYPGSGAHRLRLLWDAETLTALFQVDEDYTGGPFQADLVSPILTGSDNGFSSSNARIFFGGSEGAVFDDFTVLLIPEPATASLGISAGFCLPCLLRLRKRKSAAAVIQPAGN